MAMIDDPDWLLSHICHSFITSDDTGMCEMVIQHNDLLTMHEHREKSKGASGQRRKTNVDKSFNSASFGKASGALSSKILLSDSVEELPLSPTAVSPDILSGWDFGIRRRSNTAQKLERIRKERQNRIKVKTIHWKDMPEQFVSEQLDTMFVKKSNANELEADDPMFESVDPLTGTLDVLKLTSNERANAVCDDESTSSQVPMSVSSKVISTKLGFDVTTCCAKTGDSEKVSNASRKLASSLSMQLSQCVHIISNPFKDYSKYDGRGCETSSITQKITLWVWIYGEDAPIRPLPVTILVAGVRVSDLIGLSCWQYMTEKRTPPLKHDDVHGYSLHIAEDDGEVDYGFPALENNEPLSKFGFPTLALVEQQPVSDDTSDETKFKKSLFVKVNDYAGFSLIQVDDLSILMGNILVKAMKRRKGNKYTGKYLLEYIDKPGVAVDDSQTLESTGAMQFYMLREHSARRASHVIAGDSRGTQATNNIANSSNVTMRSSTVRFSDKSIT